ncbi:MAG: protein kinase [Thermoanaerobaculia bacterium]|jgi:serine/threonine protein kinase
MEIQTGTRLGPYEILAPIGAGGMGQVWRAKDTRLDREVAIKVLPPDFATNTQFLARFEREAKSISSLNHPHICTLHDVGHESGAHFLVMEMIEGESLADRLVKGRLPMDQVLRIGGQIAAALDAAHRKGIIHRDLKPGNVMLTKSGAKLLDFGLAKAGAPTSGVISGLTDMPTQARPLTQEGTILGTFQYMAPEQLEGAEADARTDIFALGALLYEMATGTRAFDGKTRTSLIASIVSGTPRPVSELVPMTPPAFEHVVRRCLEKEADDRWQSAHDIADQLRWISEAGSQAGVPVPVARRRITRDRILAVALAVALVAVGALALRVWQERSGARQSFNLTIPSITDDYSRAGLAEISPDGTMVAFSADGTDEKRRLWVRRLDSFKATPLDGTESPGTFCWSPDSQALAFASRGKVNRVSVDGGPVTVIADHQSIPALQGLAWGSSGVILAGSTEVGVHKVAASGGAFELLTKPDSARNERGHANPRFLADGRRFTFVAPFRNPATHELLKRLYVGSLGAPSREIGPTSSSVFVDESSGYMLFVSDGTLMAVKFDAASGTTNGDAVPILDDVFYFDPIGSANVSLSSTGVLTAQSRAGGSRLQWLDLAGRRLPGFDDMPVATNFRFSIDGARVFAGALDTKLGTYDLYAFDATRSGGTRLTYGRGWEAQPVPARDGKSVYYAADRVGPPDIMLKTLDSPEEDRTVLSELSVQFPNDVSPDGKLLLYQTDHDPAMRVDLWILPLTGDAKPYPFVRSPYAEAGGRFSPDGTQVSYMSNESGRTQVYVRPFPGPGPARQVSQTTGTFPRWSHDGRSLFYLSDGKLLRATAPFTGEPELLFENRDIVSFELAPDETRILAVMTTDFDASPPTRVVTGWRSLLDKHGK